jgi:rhodanese-related sulfurtransferase
MQIEVERLRESLSTELYWFDSNPNVVGLSASHKGMKALEDDPTAFDDVDEETDASEPHPDQNAESASNDDLIPPERRPVILPSTHMQDNKALCQAELQLRIKQATRYLSTIRQAVAEKSFQYSHVMRSAPSKGVRTRSRGTIAKINHRIAFYCRVYGRSRAAMVRLKADDHILHKFGILLKDDVKASTAILDPNIPGSSGLRLSWIWHTGPSGSGPDAMRECKSGIWGLGLVVNINCQFNVYIGFESRPKRTDGTKSSCWSNMRWNGLQDILYTEHRNGKKGTNIGM